MQTQPKLNFSVLVGKFYSEGEESLNEIYQSDDKTEAIYRAKNIYVNEYDHIKVINNLTGEQVWGGLRTSSE